MSTELAHLPPAWMCGRCAVLGPTDVLGGRFEIDLLPAQWASGPRVNGIPPIFLLTLGFASL
jgi:hypothetical protein